MKIIRSFEAMREQVQAWRRQGQSIGLVPTMGYLHEGHLALVRNVQLQADVAVVSIFVNPTQFGPNEDFTRYPHDFAADEKACRATGVTAIFQPSAELMYPADFSTWVNESELSQGLCGRSRPGHFRGVATVVTKLFNLTGAEVAVFGQKDIQQALIIERLAKDLNLPVRIVIAPIVRETDGLAMSSRNCHLSADERRDAPAIFRGLTRAQAAFAEGERNTAVLRGLVVTELEAVAARIDYVELVDHRRLQPLTLVQVPAVLAVAAFFGRTRLIDNLILSESVTTQVPERLKAEVSTFSAPPSLGAWHTACRP